MRRGFTLAELLVGLAITLLVMAALSAFTMSMAQAWKTSETVQAAQVASVQAMHRMEETIRAAKYLGWGGKRTNGSGDSALLFWKSDDENNGRMEVKELALLEHSAADGTLKVYMVPATANNGQTLCDVTDLDAEEDVETFKALPNLRSAVLLRNVPEISFLVHNADDERIRPSLEYVIRSERDGRSVTDYQTATLRSPRYRPVRCETPANCQCPTNCECSGPSACGCAASHSCRTSSSHCAAETPTPFSSTSGSAGSGNTSSSTPSY